MVLKLALVTLVLVGESVYLSLEFGDLLLLRVREAGGGSGVPGGEVGGLVH